jgi:hypothetical protein
MSLLVGVRGAEAPVLPPARWNRYAAAVLIAFRAPDRTLAP